jgi:hypothetical protein
VYRNWKQRNLDSMGKYKDSQNEKRNQLTSKKQPQNQKRIPSKKKSDTILFWTLVFHSLSAASI